LWDPIVEGLGVSVGTVANVRRLTFDGLDIGIYEKPPARVMSVLDG
jgi:hypothetical protein